MYISDHKKFKNMKKLILLTALGLLIGGVEANAQTKDRVVAGKANFAMANPLMKFYGKTLSIARHIKDDQPVNHVAADYVLIKADNTAEVKFGQDLLVLNWTYDKDKNQVALVVASNNQQTVWNIQRSEADNLVLFNELDKEMLSLIPKQ